MATCVYPYCLSRPKDLGAVRYYRFPENEELRKKWMSVIPQVLGLSKEKITPRSYLCANHFEKECFVFGNDGKVKSMKPSAIPALFYMPPKITDAAAPGKADAGPDVVMVEEDVPTPTVTRISSYASLSKKIQFEQVFLQQLKEKIQKEEEESSKMAEQIKSFESGDRSWEVEETYQKLLKKMRPIAPKQPQKKKPKTLEEIIISLRKERKISEEAGVVLLHLFADVSLDDNTGPPSSKDSLTCFAQVLTFYSSHAFENIRSTFDVKLPKISFIRSLYNGQQGEPGWNRDAFTDLRQMAKKVGPDKKLLCTLLMDEISLKREEEWDGKKMRGFVDYGPLITNHSFDMDVDGLPRARSVLVFMVVPLDQKQCWKVPVAYFFVNNLTSAEKANIIRECIMRLHSMGTVALSLTLKLHLWEKGLLDSLGVCIDLLPNLCPYFVHPTDPLLRVHVIFDHCSVLSSVQNLWYSIQIFKDCQGMSIEWKYVSELLKIQEAQASSAFDNPFWCWETGNTKNRFLAQLFTTDTADAIEYCWTDLKLPQFEGSEGTIEFIRTMAKVSLLLNSKKFNKSDSNPNSRYYLQLLEYLSKLQDSDGHVLYTSSNGAIRCLYITLMSCQELHRQVPSFSSNSASLDHLEVLSYIIRSYIGWDVTPTARQFTAAITRHILKYGYYFSWAYAQVDTQWWVDSLDVEVARKEGRLACKPNIPSPSIPVGSILPIVYEHLFPIGEFGTLYPYHFVAIFVVKSIAQILHCNICLLALQEPFTTDNSLLRLLRRTCGAIVCPSRDVLLVCATAEHHLQLRLKIIKKNSKLKIFEWNDDKLITKIGISVMMDLLQRKNSLFSCLSDHLQDCEPTTNHLYRLVRGITSCYVQMRLRTLKSWCPV